MIVQEFMVTPSLRMTLDLVTDGVVDVHLQGEWEGRDVDETVNCTHKMMDPDMTDLEWAIRGKVTNAIDFALRQLDMLKTLEGWT